MNAREVLETMIRTDRGSMTVWSPAEACNAVDAFRAEVLREAASVLEGHARQEFREGTTAYGEWHAAAAELRRVADDSGHATPTEDEGPDICGRCRQPFDPTDARFDGRARHSYSPFCRRCVDRCHESTDAFHVCPVCRTGAEGGDSRG
ncbi:RING finger protein [Streptomyces sp. NPDC059590]|uniref:RING finger protein n=1 Tax=Streptomyces sp. NPDC059590 TaxID=3346877 RepID=UPI00369584CC